MASIFVRYFLLMFISPISGLALSLTGGNKLSTDAKRWLLVAFVTIFGSILTMNEGHDAFVHLSRVHKHYLDLSFTQFLSECYQVIMFKEVIGVNDDLYIHTLSYITGGILKTPGLFFVFVSFIYGYFFSGSLFKIFKSYPGVKKHWFFFALAAMLLIWKNIDGINTVRTWTGMWVLFYACISYYQTRKWKYILLMFVPAHIHIGYFIMAIPAWGVLFAGLRKYLFAIALAFSFVGLQFNSELVLLQLSTSEVGASKAQGYYTEETLGTAEVYEQYQGSTWYMGLFKAELHQVAMTMLAFLVIFSGVYFRHMNKVEASLFSIGILNKALANAVWFIFAINNRSEHIAGLFILASLILLLNRTGKLFPFTGIKAKVYNVLMGINFIIFIPFFIYKLAEWITFLSVFNLLFPFVPWVVDCNMSIREFIGIFIGW